MAKNLILSKESSESEIKRYFNAVLELAQSANEFPINLDEVFPLVYERKDSAVKALKENFIEGVDYKLLRQKMEQVSGAKWVDNYFITVSCMEYFIARKVRAVFEVYRQVFHKTAELVKLNQPKPKSTSITPTKVKASIEWVRGVSELLNLNDSSKLLLLGKVAKPLELPLPDYTPSKGVLKSASELLKERGLQVSCREFNARAIERGFLCEIERKAKFGQIKKFKSITKKGLLYGENQVSPNNPNSTQPHWYADKFVELLNLILESKSREGFSDGN